MRILLTANLPYTRSSGGANRSNRGLCEALARRGHQIEVVVPLLATPSRVTAQELLEALSTEGLDVRQDGSRYHFRINGVDVLAVKEPSELRGCLVSRLRSFAPDWALVSAEDPSQNLLDAALKTCPGRVLYLAHTPQMFPFGPLSLYPGGSRTELVKQAAAVVAISSFVAGYVREWTGIEAHVVHFPHYGEGPFPLLGRFESCRVLLLNASRIKGLSLFLELARRLPEVEFAAVAGYATTGADHAALASLPNTTLLPNSRRLDDLLQGTKVLLMPSLWTEGFGMAAVDAMLRGIPVLASDFGGLREALLGTAGLLPVRPIERFEETLDEAMLPAAIVPEQDVRPWLEALSRLVSDRDAYERQSALVRRAATEFFSGLSALPFEQLLGRLASGEAREGAFAKASSRIDGEPGSQATGILKRIEELTPKQRAVFFRRFQARLGGGCALGSRRPESDPG